MKAGGSVLVIIVALLVMYLAVSGRYRCIEFFWTCISSSPDACTCVGASAGAVESDAIRAPAPATLPPITALAI